MFFLTFSAWSGVLVEKQKNPDSFENQDFKWCHQESNYLSKWLNIFDL